MAIQIKMAESVLALSWVSTSVYSQMQAANVCVCVVYIHTHTHPHIDISMYIGICIYVYTHTWIHNRIYNFEDYIAKSLPIKF